MDRIKLIDQYDRHLRYLRVSITDRCNLRCIYCTPGGRLPKLSHDDILTYEEIIRIVELSTRLGITKIRVTGGEPLMRKGVYDFLKSLVKIKGLKDISLTTNGVLLRDNIEKIRAAGIKRINISLDTMNPEKFKKITGYDFFERVWEGIIKANEMGFYPIKLNVVTLKGYNDDEFLDFAKLSIHYPFHVRFIEYMPIGNPQMRKDDFIFAHEIRSRLRSVGELVPVRRDFMDGPAERLRFDGAKGEIGFIPAMSRHFCNTCNRLRLTADGQLRPCLLFDKQTDVKNLLRQGCTDDMLAKAICQAVKHKREAHGFAMDNPFKVADQMVDIGG